MTETEIRTTIEPHPQSGEENMRIDANLLGLAVGEGISTLRLYEWNEPTLSLGYFQKNPRIPDSLASLPVVRRLSGGGAIVHDRELTYSIALTKDHARARRPLALYASAHRAIIGVLRTFGLTSCLRGEDIEDKSDHSFLCFSRADRNDIVVGSEKIVGSAQRRRRGAVLQHGSILLQRSQFAPDYCGVFDLGLKAPLSDLRQAVALALSEAIRAPEENG